jgi:hypothetical protein
LHSRCPARQPYRTAYRLSTPIQELQLTVATESVRPVGRAQTHRGTKCTHDSVVNAHERTSIQLNGEAACACGSMPVCPIVAWLQRRRQLVYTRSTDHKQPSVPTESREAPCDGLNKGLACRGALFKSCSLAVGTTCRLVFIRNVLTVGGFFYLDLDCCGFLSAFQLRQCYGSTASVVRCSSVPSSSVGLASVFVQNWSALRGLTGEK